MFLLSINRSPYSLMKMGIGKENLSEIVYEAVNRKAAEPCDQDKRAPKPRTRKKREQEGTVQE